MPLRIWQSASKGRWGAGLNGLCPSFASWALAAPVRVGLGVRSSASMVSLGPAGGALPLGGALVGGASLSAESFLGIVVGASEAEEA